MKKLFRQELKSYTPEWNAKCSIITDLIFSIGISMLYFSKRYSLIEIEYSSCLNNVPIIEKNTKKCTIPFQIKKTIKSPIYIYYKLKNFYLNHRLLVESKSWKELRGEETSTISKCKNSYLINNIYKIIH